MKFRVVLEYDQETESYAIYCPELPGCTSAGDKKKRDAKRHFTAGIKVRH